MSTSPNDPDRKDAREDDRKKPRADRPRRRRTVLVSGQWAASAAVIAAMSMGTGALAPDNPTPSGDHAEETAQTDEPPA